MIPKMIRTIARDLGALMPVFSVAFWSLIKQVCHGLLSAIEEIWLDISVNRPFLGRQTLRFDTQSLAIEPFRAILGVVGLVHTEINKGFAGTF